MSRPAAFHSVYSCAGSAPGEGEPELGYRRIHGELLVLGLQVAASTVWQILTDAGIDTTRVRIRRRSASARRPLRTQVIGMIKKGSYAT